MTEEQAAEFLKKKGWGVISPQTNNIDLPEDFLSLWSEVKPFTMISIERAYALYHSLCYLSENHIEGDIVECGVWKGGACMLAARTILKKGYQPRKIWLYDTFTGMTDPTENDLIAASNQPVSERSPQGWWAIPRSEVEGNMKSTGYDEALWETVEGDVLQTLDHHPKRGIALLRLDTDWYESTKKEMDALFPLLVEGGILLLDDYGHFKGAAKAVDEFFSKREEFPLLQRVDYTGRLFLKK